MSNALQSGSLELREREDAPELCCDLSTLQPARLTHLSLKEIASIPVAAGSKKVELGDLFSISGTATSTVHMHFNRLRIDNLGAGMSAGSLLVYGDVGDGVGQGMSGGLIDIHGSAGDAVGAGMRQGRIVVRRSIGHRGGGVSSVGGRAMRGGEIIVCGDAGNQLGERMRRGVIYVAGNAADDGARRMIAGTIVVGGSIGYGWASGMKRGSVIIGQPAQAASWQAALTAPYEFELSFLPLLWNFLKECVPRDVLIPTARWAQRQIGDLDCGGKGEVLTLTRHSQILSLR